MSWFNLMTEEKIKNHVLQSRSKSHLLKNMGLIPYGGNYRTLNALIKKYNINISHFKGRSWSKGIILINKSIPLKDILIKNSTYTNSSCLKKRLLKEKIFIWKCYNCNKTEWLGKPIPLELEHKNGKNQDNRLKNLTLLCPNCHAFIKFYRGRKVNWDKLKIKIKKSKILIFCSVCKKQLRKKNKNGLCVKCIKISKRKVIRPNKEELIQLIQLLPYTIIGKKYGVSDNAIRKWAKQYNIELPNKLGYWSKIKAKCRNWKTS